VIKVLKIIIPYNNEKLNKKEHFSMLLDNLF